jgi:hypothetical protein
MANPFADSLAYFSAHGSSNSTRGYQPALAPANCFTVNDPDSAWYCVADLLT